MYWCCPRDWWNRTTKQFKFGLTAWRIDMYSHVDYGRSSKFDYPARAHCFFCNFGCPFKPLFCAWSKYWLLLFHPFPQVSPSLCCLHNQTFWTYILSWVEMGFPQLSHAASSFAKPHPGALQSPTLEHDQWWSLCQLDFKPFQKFPRSSQKVLKVLASAVPAFEGFDIFTGRRCCNIVSATTDCIMHCTWAEVHPQDSNLLEYTSTNLK